LRVVPATRGDLATWPGADRRSPPYSMPTYAVRAPLARWIEAEARAAAVRKPRGLRVLDVGCGQKPYYPFFAPFDVDYVGLDVVDNPLAELRGSVEAIPAAEGSFDLVLCTQVLEHCDDPAQGVRELRRVLASGGRALVSTHGVQVYHPSPQDLWRWTHAGLARLFETAAQWERVVVEPASGTAACLAMLLAIYADLAAKRAHVRPVARGVAWALNRGAEGLDRRRAILREPRPGTLFANLHVTADAPA
jgi:SAM-dependent methyltransferase